MSLLNRFSVSGNMEKANRKSRDRENQNSTVQIPINLENRQINREIIWEDIIEPLLLFGYSLEQVMIAFKIYKFQTVDEAIYIMMRDPETGKYCHRFQKTEIKNLDYEKVAGAYSECQICYERREEHINYDGPDREDTKLDVAQFKNTDYDTTLTNPNKQSSVVLNESKSQRKALLQPEIHIPKDTLDSFEDPEICRICFAEKASGETKAQFACGHKFCKACVNNHLLTNINNGKVYYTNN